MSARTKRVFQLRKTGGTVRQSTPQEDMRVVEAQNEREDIREQSNEYAENSVPFPENTHRSGSILQKHDRQAPEVDGPELYINELELHFKQKINNVQVKNITLKNIGSSAIYYEWNFKNISKKNASAIKDPKPKFYTHYQANVIQPGEQLIFSFSFLSQIPGIFVEEYELICNPLPQTTFPPIKLKGEAYIEDEWMKTRNQIQAQLSEKNKSSFAQQIVYDVIENVKSPPVPLPDVSQPEIAERQFEAKNFNQRLYYNSQVHEWFTDLFRQVCQNRGIQSSYWDQSVQTISLLIADVEDPILKESFKRRLQNYCFMSTQSPPSKSELFPMIRSIISETVFQVGGTLSDQAKKELEMWEIPFETPKQESTQQQAKQRKEQRAKIIGEWAKKMKKKKWGEQEEKQMLKQFTSKLQKSTAKKFLSKLDGLENFAEYERAKSKLKAEYDHKSYFGFLERLKTVSEYPLDGKKIFVKFELKLKENCEEQLQELEDYIKKKKEQEIRLEEEKKNQETNPKKKKAPIKKKKGQKEEEQAKPLFFDFNSILDFEAWEGVTETIKMLIEKQPFLLIIGCSYGPSIGAVNQKFSVKFLLEHLKTIEPSIEFLPHSQLFALKSKIDDESLNEGSIFFTQNLSFLPAETLQKQETVTVEEIVNGETKQKTVQKQEKLLMSEIKRELDLFTPAIEVIVREDRFRQEQSGIATYSGVNSVLGLLWWKYIAVGLRSQDSHIVLGGKLTPQRILLVSRILKFAKSLYLCGEIGLKFWLAKNKLEKPFFKTSLSGPQNDAILQLLEGLKESNAEQKLIIPQDFDILSIKQEKQEVWNYPEREGDQNEGIVIDIGKKSLAKINQIQSGGLFVIERPSISAKSNQSLSTISRNLYQRQDLKKQRHQQQRSTPSGINYENDLVIYLIGIKQQQIESIELVEKKSKKKDQSELNQEEGEPEEDLEEEEPAEEESELKKIALISDFRLEHVSCFESILKGEFNVGLKDVCRYQKSD